METSVNDSPTTISSYIPDDLYVDGVKYTNEVVFHTEDINGTTIVLKKSTLETHIAGESGDHPERHFLNLESNLLKVKRILEHPNQILRDKSNENRNNYIATVAFETQNNVKGVKIVTEEKGTNFHEVVTLYSNKTLNESVEGRVIYDIYSNQIW